MKPILTYFIIFLFIIYSSFATPEFSLWTGNRCSACHINPQGGGMRNDFGWKFGNDASFFSFKDIGLNPIAEYIDKGDNSFFNGLLSIGTDFRYQSFRSHKTENATRRYFPMQASLYLSSTPLKWLTLQGQYNIGPLIFPAQKDWSASLILKPIDELPSLRVGFFQPAFGLRDCDMTSLDRRVASTDGTASLIPPDYAELALELNYESLDWLSVALGIADSRSLSEISLYGEQLSIVAVKDNPTFTGRLVIFPKLLEDFLPESYLGSSLLINGDFLIINSFIGVALFDDLQLIFRYSGSNKYFIRKTDNFIAGLTYSPYKGIFLGVKGEYGITKHILTDETYIFKTYQIVANAKIFILPFVEFIPEYRYIDCEEYRSTRWAVQLHLYY
jgi:hypothetical protein